MIGASAGSEQTGLSLLRIKKQNVIDLLALTVFCLLAIAINWKTLQEGLIYGADDIWWHVGWLHQFTHELAEGIIYPRWLAGSNFLYGSPTFVFYPPLTFYAGALIQAVAQLSVEKTTIALFLIYTCALAVTFYFSTRELFGKAAAFVGAVTMETAPYVAFDIYFRGALAELGALVWLPLFFFSTDRMAKSKKWCVVFSLSICFLALSHLPSLFIFSLAWLTRLFFLALTQPEQRPSFLKRAAVFGLIGLGLSSFYLLPAIIEQPLVNISAVLDRQPWQGSLICSPAFSGYFLLPDVILKTGFTAVLLFVVSMCISYSRLTGELKTCRRDLIYWLTLSLLSLFLMSGPSDFLWRQITLLEYLQFPWRFLTVLSLAMAVLATITTMAIELSNGKAYLKNLLWILLAVLIARNLTSSYFLTKFRAGVDRPSAYISDRSSIKLSEYGRFMMPRLILSSDGYPGVPEYRPLLRTGNGTPAVPPNPHHGQPNFRIVSGDGNVRTVFWKSYERQLLCQNVQPVTLRLRTFYYPAWRFYVDGRRQPIEQAPDGSIQVLIGQGMHRVDLRYEETEDFYFGLAITMVSLFCLIRTCASSGADVIGININKK